MTLTRPISIMFPLYFLIITLFIKGFSFKNNIIQIIILFSIFMVGVGPWTYRAYTITGKVVPLVSYDTTYLMDKDTTESNEDLSKIRHKGFAGKFKEEIKNPIYFIKNSFVRLGRFWYYGHSTPVRIINGLLQFPLLLLSILGIWWAKKQEYLIFPILIVICYFWLAYSATHAISRYSFPMVALLCPFAAIGITNFAQKIFKAVSNFFLQHEN